MSQHTELRLEYEVRARELLDLLFTPDQIGLLVEKFSSVVNPAGQAPTFADVDQYMWNYHPRTRSSHRGVFYQNPATITGLRGGDVTRTLVSADHEGMAQWLRDFLLPDSESGGSNPTGYGYDQLVQHASDSSIPNRPTLTYVGENGFPRDGLAFQSSEFSDPQGSGTFVAMEWRVAEIHNPNVPNYDPTQRNIYEVEGTWESGELSAFANQITIPELVVKPDRTYRARVRMQDSSGRWSQWSDAVEFLVTPAANTVAGDLVISEINYNPYDPTTDELAAIPGVDNDEFEFIEVVNVNPTQAISLLGYDLSDAVSYSFGNVDLAPGERAVIVEDVAAFTLRYGDAPNVLGQWTGGLSNSGEKIVLSDPAGQITLDFGYSDSSPWAMTPDGHGATLELIDPVETIAAAFGVSLSWRGSTEYGGTPGDMGSGPIGVIINDLLAHTDPPDVDSIELYNASSETIDLGGWFLSDSENDFFKFQISGGTSLAAGAFVVFDERDFNPGGGTIPTDFALSAGGDDVWLIEADLARQPTRLVDVVHFDATRNGVTLGRVPSGNATYDLFPLARKTLGSVNTSHEPGDLIISEVHSHPAPPPGGYTITEAQLEFVEIHNRSAGSISLNQIALDVDGADFLAWQRNLASPLGQTTFSDSLVVTATVVSDQSLQTWWDSSSTRQVGPRREASRDVAIQEVFRGNDGPIRVESIAALVTASRPTRRMGPYRRDMSGRQDRERLQDLGLADYLASSVST